MKLTNHPFADKVIIPFNIKGDKKYYLYIHYREDKQETFYIGIGTKHRPKEYNRAFCYKKRNSFWKKVVNKTKYSIFIISESNNREEIINQEINYIKLFGKKKDKLGSLVNITDGGEGCKGSLPRVWTEEMREKIRIANSNRIISEETREKLRQALKNRGIINKKKV
jgi:hypothetical protein